MKYLETHIHIRHSARSLDHDTNRNLFVLRSFASHEFCSFSFWPVHRFMWVSAAVAALKNSEHTLQHSVLLCVCVLDRLSAAVSFDDFDVSFFHLLLLSHRSRSRRQSQSLPLHQTPLTSMTYNLNAFLLSFSIRFEINMKKAKRKKKKQ